jgi:hypothetical protein
MRGSAVKDGWQRFLDRLRRLWGKPRAGELSKTLGAAAGPLVQG